MAERRRSARDAGEGRRGGGTGAGAGACGGDGSAVELSLRLRTGGSSAAQQEEEEAAAAAARKRRSMTIFYNGQVCAVDVTELQARAIISMANQENLTEQQHRDHDRHHHQDSSSGATAQCGAGRGHQNPTAPEALLRAAHCQASPASPRQSLEAAAATAPMINHAATGLSMKRSLQRFLQKRKTRAAAVASPYAGGRPAQHHETLGGA